MIKDKIKLKSDLSIFIGITLLLITIGLICIYSASSVFALEKMGSSHFFIKKHAIGLCIGLLIVVFLQLIPLEILKQSSPYFFLFSLILTGLTIFSPWGQYIHGSSRWLSIGSFSFQPSELLKISLILYLAYFLTKQVTTDRSYLQSYIQVMIILAVTGFLLLKQPDFGLTITLTVSVLFLLCIMGKYTTYLKYSLLVGIPLVCTLIIAKSYRLKRILVFLNPWSDPQGAGFQIIQSLIAIGSGGI